MNYAINLPDVDPRFYQKPFGRQIEPLKKIEAFTTDPTTQSLWLSAKRKSFRSAMAEFKRLYRPTQFYARHRPEDDSFQVFYKE